MTWDEYVRASGVPSWPYPLRYGEEEAAEADVLVLGGGIAGCWAAIAAAREGATVALVEKGATICSGSGGTGCDHWLNTPHPGSKVTAEEVLEWELEASGGYTNCLTRYIAARESYETLLELEAMGAKIRDVDDAFRGAAFRDERSKFLFTYDHENRIHFRVWGSTFKRALYRECKRLGVRVRDRAMATGLLTDGGRAGARVIGATALDTRTGAFLVFRAGAVVDCLSRHQRNWCFSTDTRGIANFRPTQIVGDGHAMAWRAGGTFALMERSRPSSFASPRAFPPYGHANAINTWFPCTLVDARGKQVPYVDRDGRVVEDEEGRSRPAPGQKYLGERTLGCGHRTPQLPPDLEERVRKGEFALPLYADLPGMTEHGRRAIWGLMVGEEGKTKIPVLRTYTEAGFDPERDLLQSYLFLGGDPMRGPATPQERTGGEIGDAGGLVVDWDLRTTLEGLYAAGDALFAANYHYHAATTGRYAGRKAARAARGAALALPDRRQLEEEKARAYLPLGGTGELEWKELNGAVCRVMQNYCGDLKNEHLLAEGLAWLRDLEENEAPRLAADNPHKLVRSLEVLSVLTCSELILHASRARRASSRLLDFQRQDFPEVDPPSFHKWVTVRQREGTVEEGALPIDFWGDLEGNYENHR
ncbi:MAG: FAD-dependent oxidoreductase [Deltaproteobacteria bacterium]|nr:FAD-dependent oxidoreductase [Deltaproteobacteria bacterium]